MNMQTTHLLEELEVHELDARNQYNWDCGTVDCSTYVTAVGGVVAAINPIAGAVIVGIGLIMEGAGC